MFYGLNKFIKEFLPKRLFYRSLIIVATPIILLQIIITVVFFDSLWIKANKGMTRSLVGEIETLLDVYKNPDVGVKQTIINLYNQNFDFVVAFKENEILPKNTTERWYSPMDRSLRRELKPVFDFYTWIKWLYDTKGVRKTSNKKLILESINVNDILESGRNFLSYDPYGLIKNKLEIFYILCIFLSPAFFTK